MPDPVEVFVLNDPAPTQTKGDWIVKVGAGRGGKKISRHQQKTVAEKRARREGRKRKDQPGGAVLKIQDKGGRIHTESHYGDAQDRGGGGILGGLL